MIDMMLCIKMISKAIGIEFQMSIVIRLFASDNRDILIKLGTLGFGIADWRNRTIATSRIFCTHLIF